MAALPVNVISKAGIAPAPVTAAASDTIDVNLLGGRPAILHAKNTSGGAVTFTVVDNGKTPGGSSGAVNAGVSVPATTGDREILVLPDYADAAGLITVTTSAQGAGITSMVKRLP
jgi:hypothetical protein